MITSAITLLFKLFQIDECFRECIKKCGDGFVTTICTGQGKVSMPWKLDEEADFQGISNYVHACDI